MPCLPGCPDRRMRAMTAPSRHEAHDRLRTRVNLALRRASRLADELDADESLSDSEFAERANELAERCRARADMVDSWTEVEIGAQTAVEDLAAAVDALEADVAAARATEPSGYEEAVDRQVRSWRTRIDRLRLQSGLASMDARDEMDEVVHRLEETRATVLQDLQNVVGDAREIVIDLRNDAEVVFGDVRRTVEHAAAKLTGS